VTIRVLRADDHRIGRGDEEKACHHRRVASGAAVRYLQIPAADVEVSARFYAEVFGWAVRTSSHGATSFDDGDGVVSGTWLTGRPPSREPGMVVWLRVDDVAATLERIESAGGEVVSGPEAQGEPEAIATFRDPAGNVLGVFHERGG
jgi:predicted enzyme related to lactoylglutathione lyase